MANIERKAKATSEQVDKFISLFSSTKNNEKRKVIESVLIGRGKYINYQDREKQFKTSYNHLSIATQNLYKTYINQFTSWLASELDLKDVKPLKKIKGTVTRKKGLSSEEFNNIIKLSSDKYQPIITVQYILALRVSELTQIKWEQLAADESLNINNKGRIRTIPIPSKLRELAKGRKGLVLMDQQALQKYLKRLGVKSGVPRLTSHLIRHYRATELLSKGATLTSIRDLLGHSNISITDTYLHASDEDIKSMLEL